MSYIFQKVENTEECTPIEPKIKYSIEFLPEQLNQAKSILSGTDGMWSHEEDANTLHFKNKRSLLKAGTILVLNGIKIVKTEGL